MWDKLNSLVTNTKRSQEVLTALKTFSLSYTPLVRAFTSGIRQATD